MTALDEKGLEDEDIIYGTSTIRKYLKKFHGVEISDADLNDRLTKVISEEIEEAEVNPNHQGQEKKGDEGQLGSNLYP